MCSNFSLKTTHHLCLCCKHSGTERQTANATLFHTVLPFFESERMLRRFFPTSKNRTSASNLTAITSTNSIDSSNSSIDQTKGVCLMDESRKSRWKNEYYPVLILI